MKIGIVCTLPMGAVIKIYEAAPSTDWLFYNAAAV
jgi:hypothetical protein